MIFEKIKNTEGIKFFLFTHPDVDDLIKDTFYFLTRPSLNVYVGLPACAKTRVLGLGLPWAKCTSVAYGLNILLFLTRSHENWATHIFACGWAGAM